MTHQKLLAGKNVVCDRYLWSGIAYAHKYSPGCFRLLKELYLSESLFMQPDLYILVDTPPQVCFERDASLDLDVLKELRTSYMLTREYVRTPVIVTEGVNGEESAMQALIPLFDSYMSSSASK
jgi:thymidylate kinase